jgi:cyanophycinase
MNFASRETRAGASAEPRPGDFARPTAPGPLALLGGGEHRYGCEPIDRWLMDRVGRGQVRVTVIPAASNAATLPSTAALARNYWTELGADVTIVAPHQRMHAQAAALAEPDIIVLTGGVPGRLVRTLAASPVWERVLQLWRDGAALSGSSAGAMALFAWRLALRAPHPLRLIPALGPLRDDVCVPHFDRFVTSMPALHPWVRRMERGFSGLGVLGLDESTALVIDGEHSHVHGRGAVTLIDGQGWRTHVAGTAVALPRPLLIPPQRTAVAA